jgi:hypothetical protein
VKKLKLVEKESTLKKLKSRELALIEASQKILKHIKKEQPLIVKRQDYVVIVDNNNLLIERNVI